MRRAMDNIFTGLAGLAAVLAALPLVIMVGGILALTPMEFQLLITLVERRGRVQTRERLLSDVWGYRQGLETRTVDTHVRRLREKLGAAGRLIETVRGFGYVARVTSGRGDSR